MQRIGLESPLPAMCGQSPNRLDLRVIPRGLVESQFGCRRRTIRAGNRNHHRHLKAAHGPLNPKTERGRPIQGSGPDQFLSRPLPTIAAGVLLSRVKHRWL